MLATRTNKANGVTKASPRGVKNPNANVVRATRTNKANVPADLQSAGNEYQDLFNPITSYS